MSLQSAQRHAFACRRGRLSIDRSVPRSYTPPAVSGSPISPPAFSTAAMSGLSVVPRSRRFSSPISKQACSSILVRPASGFLQVSLSKVLRPEYFTLPAILLEALPIKANDQGGPIAQNTGSRPPAEFKVRDGDYMLKLFQNRGLREERQGLSI
jgi:hypothetical protein